VPAFRPAGSHTHDSKNKLDQKRDRAANQCHDKNSQKRKTQMVGFVKFNYPADNMFHPFASAPSAGLPFFYAALSGNQRTGSSIPATSYQTPARPFV